MVLYLLSELSEVRKHIPTLPQEVGFDVFYDGAPLEHIELAAPWESKLQAYCRYKGLGRWTDAAMNRIWGQHCESFIEFCYT